MATREICGLIRKLLLPKASRVVQQKKAWCKAGREGKRLAVSRERCTSLHGGLLKTYRLQLTSYNYCLLFNPFLNSQVKTSMLECVSFLPYSRLFISNS